VEVQEHDDVARPAPAAAAAASAASTAASAALICDGRGDINIGNKVLIYYSILIYYSTTTSVSCN